MNAAILNKFWIVLAFFVLVINAIIWSFKIPYNSVPDESTHLATAAFIYEKGRLPVFNQDQEATIDKIVRYDFNKSVAIKGHNVVYSSMPYIGYIFSALFMKALGAINPHYLAWYARIPSVISYGVFLIFIWLISCRIFDAKDPLRYLIPWFAANIPQVVFISSYTNNDIMSLAISVWVIYSWFKLYDLPADKFPSPFFYGAALGFLGFAKLNYYLLFPFTLAVYLLGITRKSKDRRAQLAWLIKVMGLAFVISGWVWIRNFMLYGDFFGVRPFIAKFQESTGELTGYSQGFSFFSFYKNYFMVWLFASFESGLAKFDWASLSVPLAVICCFIVLSIFSIFNFYRFIQENSEKIKQSFAIYLCLFMLLPAAVFLSLWNCYYVSFQAQGRYLYPALIPCVVIFCSGIVCFLKNRNDRITISGIIGVLIFAFNIYCLNGLIIPKYASSKWHQDMRRTNKAWDYKAYIW
jgi:hypothetical protein